MDVLEKQYFSRPRNHITTRHYVLSLIESGRILEASFYCKKMLDETPRNKSANSLAFFLAIWRMDPAVEKYDEALVNSGAALKDRLVLHCRYYFAFRIEGKLRDALSALMDEDLTDVESIGVVLEGILWLKDPHLASKFITLYMRRNTQISQQAAREFKKILQTRLVEILSSMSRGVRG